MTINSAFIVSGTQIILICVSTHTEMQRGVMNSILKMKDWNSEGFWGLLWIISERGFESRQPVLRVLCAMPPDHRSLLWGLRFSLHVGQRLTVKFSELILLWSVDLMRSLKTLAYWMRLCPPPYWQCPQFSKECDPDLLADSWQQMNRTSWMELTTWTWGKWKSQWMDQVEPMSYQ